jgi:hypothetical protein
MLTLHIAESRPSDINSSSAHCLPPPSNVPSLIPHTSITMASRRLPASPQRQHSFTIQSIYPTSILSSLYRAMTPTPVVTSTSSLHSLASPLVPPTFLPHPITYPPRVHRSIHHHHHQPLRRHLQEACPHSDRDSGHGCQRHLGRLVVTV